MDDKLFDWYTNEAKGLGAMFPISDSRVHAGDFQTWADESLDISKHYVYPSK